MSKHARYLVFLAVVFMFAAGCAPLQNQPPQAVSSVILGEGARLEQGQTVYVARTRVNEVNAAAAKVFGIGLDEAFKRALVPFASAVTLGDVVETRQPALGSARKKKARYLFIPSLYGAQLQTFEQKPEARMSFFYSVFDVQTGRHLLMRHLTVVVALDEAAGAPESLVRAIIMELATVFAGQTKFP